MSRNYEKENLWQKQKYVRLETKLDSNEYSPLVNQVKEEIGVSEFIKQSLKLYKTNPELFIKKAKS